MKVCAVCAEEKPESEYNIRHGKQEFGKLRNECKDCQRAYKLEYYRKYNEEVKERRKQYYLDNREHLNELSREAHRRNKERNNSRKAQLRIEFNKKVHSYYGGSCFICGTSELCYEIYDCHHLDPNAKEVQVSRLVHKDWDLEVVEELKKCVYLCSNCHKKIHNHRFDKQIESGELILTPGRRS
jgi:hypothetical protein